MAGSEDFGRRRARNSVSDQRSRRKRGERGDPILANQAERSWRSIRSSAWARSPSNCGGRGVLPWGGGVSEALALRKTKSRGGGAIKLN